MENITTKDYVSIRKAVYSQCLAIEKEYQNHKTPEQIAKMFGSQHYYEEVDGDDIDYHVDFKHFGITFYGKVSMPHQWLWSGNGDVWMFDTQDWENWKMWNN